MVTTFKRELEGRISETLKITRKVIPWLIEHAVPLVNKVQVGQNGKTSFERIQGRTERGRYSDRNVMRRQRC